jgi:hypothetical protein
MTSLACTVLSVIGGGMKKVATGLALFSSLLESFTKYDSFRFNLLGPLKGNSYPDRKLLA